MLKKCLDKRKEMTRSGAAAASLPVCKYFESMQFLYDKTLNLPTESNVDLDVQIQPELFPNQSPEQLNSVYHQTPSTSRCSSTSLDEPVEKRSKRKSLNDDKIDPFLQQLKNMD